MRSKAEAAEPGLREAAGPRRYRKNRVRPDAERGREEASTVPLSTLSVCFMFKHGRGESVRAVFLCALCQPNTSGGCRFTVDGANVDASANDQLVVRPPRPVLSHLWPYICPCFFTGWCSTPIALWRIRDGLSARGRRSRSLPCAPFSSLLCFPLRITIRSRQPRRLWV
jgi:hypothetical protein